MATISPRLDAVGDAFDRAHHAARGHELDVQVLDLEQRRARRVRRALGQGSYRWSLARERLLLISLVRL